MADAPDPSLCYTETWIYAGAGRHAVQMRDMHEE
jgi:hypothetical protein